jgi:hypothetical protein
VAEIPPNIHERYDKEKPQPKEIQNVVVCIEVRTPPHAPWGGAGTVIKSLKFNATPDEANRLFRKACDAVAKERENGKEDTGVGSKPGGGKKEVRGRSKKA